MDNRQRSGVDVVAWLVGLGAFPAATVEWQRWRTRRRPARLVWLTGPAGHAATVAVFLALYLTSWYAPPVSVLSAAALVVT